MKEPHSEEVANHAGLESCAGGGDDAPSSDHHADRENYDG